MRFCEIGCLLDDELDDADLTPEQCLEIIAEFYIALDNAEGFASIREEEIRAELAEQEANKPHWLNLPYEEKGTPLLDYNKG